MQKITTKQEAEDWFLSNHAGKVIAVNSDGEEKEVDSYPDAIGFIEEKADVKPSTLVVFVLDKSGSMEVARQATISGFNEYINDLKKDDAVDYSMSLTLFDTVVEKRHTNESIANIPVLSDETYKPGGNTALYDAVFQTINETEGTVKEGQKVLCVMMTDGEENSSKEVTEKEVFKKIDELKAKGNWSFVFMGANQDSWIMGQKFGLSKQNTIDYNATDKGATMAFYSMSANTRNFANMKAEATTDFFSEKDRDDLKNAK